MQIQKADFQYLRGLVENARRPAPSGWHPWFLGSVDQPLGLMPPQRAVDLASAMPETMPLVQTEHGWIWYAQANTAAERSLVLQAISTDLNERGQLRGWRHETYSCWGSPESDWPYGTPELFRLERAAFRHFGLRSHAAHVHGITSDGRMWCGRRSFNKATDPGLLDNLAAGGMPAGEDPVPCAVREVFEEAGLVRALTDLCHSPARVLTERQEREGWHSEQLFVYTVKVLDGEQPKNRDGEVIEFMCLSFPELMSRMRAGEFTSDAACAIAATVLRGDLADHWQGCEPNSL
jgi:8-oxo-dGTP pyrophosphatase MutT (NUDIX family)